MPERIIVIYNIYVYLRLLIWNLEKLRKISAEKKLK